MRKTIFISIGGFLGAILRYTIKNMHLYPYTDYLPLNTLIINVMGSFLLALLLTVAFEVWQYDSDIRLGIATGFLGAFTTFSTLCKEIIGLMSKGYYSYALLYMTLSIVLGLAAVYFGVVLAREVIVKFKPTESDEDIEDVLNEQDSEVK